MFPHKRLLSGLAFLAVVACSTPSSARELLGSSVEDAKMLLPPDAKPILQTSSDETISYHDVRMGDVLWSEVTLRFDPAHRLASLSLKTHDLSYEALRERARNQLQIYAQEQVRAQAAFGTVSAPADGGLQIRLCQTGDNIEMTYERASRQL